MSTIYESPAKTTAICVEFRYGDPHFPTYSFLTSSSNSMPVRGQVFVPEPSLGVELEKQSGSLGDKPFRVHLPLQSDNAITQFLIDRLAEPSPFSPVRVVVYEVVMGFDGQPSEVLGLGEGSIDISRTNPPEKRGTIELEILPSKSQFKNVRLGIPANPQCGFTFGGPGCGVDTTVFHDGTSYFPNHYGGSPSRPKIRRAYVELYSVFPGSRSAAVRLELSQTQHAGANFQTLTTMPRGYWINAYLKSAGLAIPIRDWWWNIVAQTGTKNYILGKVPPSTWFYDGGLDNYLTLVPGCPKTAKACVDRDNIDNFGAFGFSIPAYNPLYDEDNR